MYTGLNITLSDMYLTTLIRAKTPHVTEVGNVRNLDFQVQFQKTKDKAYCFLKILTI